MSNMPEHSRDCTPLCVELPAYHYLDHMHSVHPGQTLTVEEVATYAIHKEEYLGVLGKEYAAKEQEKRLKIDLARLKDDAASVDNPSLFWSRVLAGYA